MIADLIAGERDWADVLLLIAMVLGVLAALLDLGERGRQGALGWLAVAVLSGGLLLQ